MISSIKEIIGLVGKPDDSVGDDTPGERIRRFLRENVSVVVYARATWRSAHKKTLALGEGTS